MNLSDSPPAPASEGARWVLLSAICASGMAFIDATALSVAMPVLQREMSATGIDLLWINNGYALPLASLLLLGGALGDRWGRARVFASGIFLFAIASLACGLSTRVPALIAARVVQGIGAAMMIPGALALVATFFDQRSRGKAIGTWSAGTVVASAIGPVLGGLLAGAGHWRWIFFLNLPLAAASLLVLRMKVPRLKEETSPEPLDLAGAWWGTIGLVAVNYGLIRWAEPGARVACVAALGIGVMASWQFTRAESRSRNPLLPLGLFRSRLLASASVLTLAFYTALNGLLFFLPLTLIQVQGYAPLDAGLAQLPIMLMLIALSPWAGAMVDRHGPRGPLTLGPAIAGAGLVLIAWPGVGHGPGEFWTTYFPGLLLLGAGLGFTAAPLSAAVINAVPHARFGAASGVNSTLARLAATLAMATLGPLFIATFQYSTEHRIARLNTPANVLTQIKSESRRLLDAPLPGGMTSELSRRLDSERRLAFIDAFRVMALIGAGLTWLGAGVSALMIQKR
jgi:EmrB/QacA subfamily drug resistance transporter